MTGEGARHGANEHRFVASRKFLEDRMRDVRCPSVLLRLLPTNAGIRLRVGEANAVGSNVTLLSSVLPESRVRGCLDATHSVSRETVFGRRQQRRTALSVTCISWVRPSTSIRPLSRQKRFMWNQATPMKRFRQRCTQVWILPVSVSRLSCHRKLKTTPLLHSARGAVTRPTGVEQAFLSIK